MADRWRRRLWAPGSASALTLASERATLAVAHLLRARWRAPVCQHGFPATNQRDHLVGGQQVDAVRNGRPPNPGPRDEHQRLACNGLSGGRQHRHPLCRQLDHVREVGPAVPSCFEFHQHQLPRGQPIGAVQICGDGDRAGRPERLLDV